VNEAEARGINISTAAERGLRDALDYLTFHEARAVLQKQLNELDVEIMGNEAAQIKLAEIKQLVHRWRAPNLLSKFSVPPTTQKKLRTN